MSCDFNSNFKIFYQSLGSVFSFFKFVSCTEVLELVKGLSFIAAIVEINCNEIILTKSIVVSFKN